jgi:N-acyl-D-aspartate/D-glutamate deacylase
MSDQPEPLRLADALSGVMYSADDVVKAAAELRRLHGEVKRMRETLSICESVFRDSGYVNCAHFIRNALKEPK